MWIQDAPFSRTCLVPGLFQFVYFVFIDNVSGIVEIHGRHMESEVVVCVGKVKIIGIHHILFYDGFASRTGLPSDLLVADKHFGNTKCLVLLDRVYVCRMKAGNAFFSPKADSAVFCLGKTAV